MPFLTHSNKIEKFLKEKGNRCAEWYTYPSNFIIIAVGGKQTQTDSKKRMKGWKSKHIESEHLKKHGKSITEFL